MTRDSDTRRMAATVKQGAGRSPSGAVPVRAIAQSDLDLIHDESAFTGHTVSRWGETIGSFVFLALVFALVIWS